ncbi:MAG: hypothetical protein ACOCRK_04565 [bacterium]
MKKINSILNKLNESWYSDKTTVIDSTRENKVYYVIHNPLYVVYRMDYEDNNYNTNEVYGISKKELDDMIIPDLKSVSRIDPISTREFLFHNIYGYSNIKDELERKGVISILNSNEFEKWSYDKVNGKDYILYDSSGKEIKNVAMMVGKVKPVGKVDNLKADRIEDKIAKNLRVRFLSDLSPNEIIKYALQSEQNYKDVQYVYASMGTVILRTEMVDFWEKVARKLKFPDKIQLRDSF